MAENIIQTVCKEPINKNTRNQTIYHKTKPSEDKVQNSRRRITQFHVCSRKTTPTLDI